MAQLAVTVVALGAVAPVHVTPVPDIVTPVAPVRLVPVMVTGTVAPRRPAAGVIDVITGWTIVVVSAAVLFAALVSVVPAGVATVALFVIGIDPPSSARAARKAVTAVVVPPSTVPLSVYVAVAPTGRFTVPVRVVMPVPVAVQEPALATQDQVLTVVMTGRLPSAPSVTRGSVSVSVAPVTAVGPLLVTTIV